MRTFEARYGGRCGECDEAIKPGQEVGYSEDDALVHTDCETVTRESDLRPDICPACFMARAANGSCDCEATQ